ncbi:uncharacterized protein PHACADRAFT_200408 [Phanerochaete carnosa HHB-10118-sp]|uniref:Uncharacterized protein n=1 Tax=Phanerochaete carnosa (strain HHB-10118-sp) TaxID=650164 RepID=K5VGX4_PHACS|nr:uncharacterized protein PHACADRAFT_200408 [Phanerochaete carnosa HHB-10118-sp]EKM50463.1 hypothetical protein PHACADRAFT_200408 [Phanerochaete carnosa HHB-10118-sp]
MSLVGLGAISCENALTVGIDLTLQNDSSSFTAFYEIFPSGEAFNFSDISFAAGDIVTVNITAATATNATSGTAFIINQSTGQTASKHIHTGSMCGADVEWTVQGLFENGTTTLAPIVDFGTVDFTDVSAETLSGPVGVSDAAIFDMEPGHTVISSVTVSSSSVGIDFL